MKNIFILIAALIVVEVEAAAQQKPGTTDYSFGMEGKQTYFDKGGAVYATAVQPDDKILQTGSYLKYEDTIRHEGILIMRYKKDGGLDETFGDNGVVITELSAYNGERGKKVTVLEDGAILVMSDMHYGLLRYWAGVLRYNSDGTLDSSFGENGLAITEFSNGNKFSLLVATDMAVQPDGNILVSGYYHPEWDDATSDIFVIRYTADGRRDESFGENGLAWIDITTQDNTKDMQVRSDGKIILASFIPVGTVSYNNYFLIQLLPDGMRDESFGTNGVIDPDPSLNPAFSINQLAIREDGKMVSAGFKNRTIVVVRYNEDGSVDETLASMVKPLWR